MTLLGPDTEVDTLELSVEVNGAPPAARRDEPCVHSRFGQSVVTADVLAATGALDHREARLRLRCMDCGVPCEIEATGRPPADGGPGIVVTFRPLEDHPTMSLGGPHAS